MIGIEKLISCGVNFHEDKCFQHNIICHSIVDTIKTVKKEMIDNAIFLTACIIQQLKCSYFKGKENLIHKCGFIEI